MSSPLLSLLFLLLLSPLAAALPGTAARGLPGSVSPPPRSNPPTVPMQRPGWPTRYNCGQQTGPPLLTTANDCEAALNVMYTSLSQPSRPSIAPIQWSAALTRAELNDVGLFSMEPLPSTWSAGACVVAVSLTQAAAEGSARGRAHEASALALRLAGTQVMENCMAQGATEGVAAVPGLGAEGLMIVVEMRQVATGQ